MERAEPFLVGGFFIRFVVEEESDGVEETDAAGKMERGGPVLVAFVDATPVTRTL
jgi:hypothetical protein|eukprot:evm.model.NODE_4365_length_7507_cov_22.568668.3